MASDRAPAGPGASQAPTRLRVPGEDQIGLADELAELAEPGQDWSGIGYHLA